MRVAANKFKLVPTRGYSIEMPLTFHPSGKMLSPNVSIIAFSIFNCYEIFFFSLFVTFLQKAKLCKAKQKFFLASTTLASFLALDFKDTDDKEHCDQQHCVPSFIFPIDSIAKNLIVATVFPQLHNITRRPTRFSFTYTS